MPVGHVATLANDLYDYGPPVTQEGETSTPANNEGVVIDNEGESPLAPPPDASTIIEPGGSPTDEVVAAHDPSISSLSPDTAVAGTDVTVTVTGERFSSASVVELDQVPVATTYVSDTELTATLNGVEGTASVTVRNPTVAQESNSVSFTFTAPEPPPEV